MQKLRWTKVALFSVSDETKQPRLKLYLKDYLVGELSSVIASGSRGKKQMDALGLNFPYCHPVGLYEETSMARYAGR